MKKTLATLACMGAMISSAELKVVPAVRKAEMKQTVATFANIIVESDDKFSAAADLFVENVKTLNGVKSAKTDGIFTGSPNISIEYKAGLPEEGYEISITDTVTISASDYNGAFYATQTLVQLIQSNGNATLPKGEIKDSPSYPVRSMLLDVGRKFIDVDGLKDWIRMLAYCKYNELHLHLNDNSWGKYPGYRLESKRFPGLSSKDGFYTFKEIRELQDFAKEYGVEIVPEIDAPGHALAFTTYKPEIAMQEMNRNGFGLAYLDLANEEAIKFMEAIYDETAVLFDSPYYHIGTDEYRLYLIKEKTKRDNYGELFRKFINHANKYLREKHNKTVRIWSGYEHMPGTTEPDKSVVIDMWETSDAVVKSKAGYKFVNSSHFYTYVVPGMPYYGVSNGFIYNDWDPRVFNRNKPETGILPAGAPGLLGGKLHVWNDGGPSGYTWNEIARLTFESMLPMGEKLWGTKGSKDYGQFLKRSAALTSVPGVELLDRPAVADENNIVWKFKGDKNFIANSNMKLNLENDPKDLEYPWTATFELTRLSDTIGHDTLMTSDLGRIYVDLEHTFQKTKKVNGKKVKYDDKKRGLAIVRAHQAPRYEPIMSNRPDILVFDYQVPMNKKVKITFVGERRKTSLYVDGKFIQSFNKQTVCPVEYLGAKEPDTFQGILHKAAIFNKVFTKTGSVKGNTKTEAVVPEIGF